MTNRIHPVVFRRASYGLWFVSFLSRGRWDFGETPTQALRGIVDKPKWRSKQMVKYVASREAHKLTCPAAYCSICRPHT